MSGSRRHRDLALAYRSLAELLRAGLPALQALASAAQTAANPHLRRALQSIRRDIEAGNGLAESMVRWPEVFPPLHRSVLRVAEKSGGLDGALYELAGQAEQMHQMRQTMLGGMVLPLLIIHAAAFIVPLPAWLLGGSMTGYLMSSLGFLGLLWVAGLIGVMLVRSALRHPPGRSILDRLVRPLPVLGRTWRELDLWRASSGIAMLLGAGVGVIEALREAAEICNSPRIAHALRAAAQTGEDGGTISEALRQSGEFPPDLVGLWATGEESGRLDELLQQAAKLYAESTQRRMQALARWIPWLAYGLVSLYLIFQILRLAGNYVRLIESFD